MALVTTRIPAIHNTVLCKCKYADEFVIKSSCLPLLTYCIGAVQLPHYKVRELVFAGMTLPSNFSI